MLLAAFAGQYLFSSGLVAADAPRGSLVLATLPTSDPDGRVRAIVISPALLAQPVIGVGNNGGRLGTGLAMSPRWYGNNKRRFGERAEEMRTILRRAGEAGHPVMSLGWDSVQLALHSLLLDGFALDHHEREPDSDKRTFQDRLRSEFGFHSAAFASTGFSELLPPESFSSVRAAPNAPDSLPDLSGMRYFHDDGPYRVYVVFGSFAFTDQERNWGVIAVDTDGVVHRAWAPRPDRSEYLGAHIGLDLADDGLILTNTEGVLTGYEWCGGKRWEASWTPHPDGRRRHHDSADGYDWHHDVTVVGDSVYSFRGSAIVEVDVATGQLRSEVHALDLLHSAWRDDLSIFQTRRKGRVGPDTLTPDSFHKHFHVDPWHFNKVDVLDPDRAAAYPGFETGDMLISARELNLVVVYRPSEERVLWWRQGLFAGQHDASFVDGHIEIFDNNDQSVPPRPRVLRLDLDEQRVDTLIDLSTWGMVMREKGNFERFDDRILTVDDAAGRVIAGKLDGSIEFVLENDWRSADGVVHRLQLRNATEVDPAVFERWQATCGG